MKNPILHEDIRHILCEMRTGDFLAVRSTTFPGLCIRTGLSRGLKRCLTNHNAPCWRDPETTEPRVLQIESPASHEMSLLEYLNALYASGGIAVLVRPDVHDRNRDDYLQRQSNKYLIDSWKSQAGTPYDKQSIQMFLRMLFRKRAHLPENDKQTIYCTEGTDGPLIENPHLPWTPDCLVNNNYPAPIHNEQAIQQRRARIVVGSKWLTEKILTA